jgi:hypothetical protein
LNISAVVIPSCIITTFEPHEPYPYGEGAIVIIIDCAAAIGIKDTEDGPLGDLHTAAFGAESGV